MSKYIEIEVKEDNKIFSIRKSHINSVYVGKDGNIFLLNINTKALCSSEKFDTYENAKKRYDEIMQAIN